MMINSNDIIVTREVSRIKTHPYSYVSEKIVKVNSNKSDAAKTRNNLISNCKTRKRKLGSFTPAKHLYTPKTYFEQSQCFQIVQAEATPVVASSNKERKRQLNWREFSVDLLGNKITWDQIKSVEKYSPDLFYQDLVFDDNLVFQVIELPPETKSPRTVTVLGRKHVIDYDYESEIKYTCLGVIKSSFRTFSQNVRENSPNEMKTLNEESIFVTPTGAHCVGVTPDDTQDKKKVKPVPAKRTVFNFKEELMSTSEFSSVEVLPPPILDFDLVPEEKIFKDVLSSFNQYDPLYLSVISQKQKLVKAAEVKPGLTFAASMSHHVSDVESVSVKPKVEKKQIKLSGSFYDFEPQHVGEYTYQGYDLSNPLYVYPKYIPSFHWNKYKNGKIERFTATDFNEKLFKFDKIVKSKVTIFENMNSVKGGKKKQYCPVEKTVSFKTYLPFTEPDCKKCKGLGCQKCNFWGSPITVKPEKWFEELSPLDNSLSPKITALGVTLSNEDKVNKQ